MDLLGLFDGGSSGTRKAGERMRYDAGLGYLVGDMIPLWIPLFFCWVEEFVQVGFAPSGARADPDGLGEFAEFEVVI